jgi:hypothetical protein
VPSDCKKAYESAQDEVQAFISTTLDTEITQKQGELFSQVDLSENRIPSSATQAVKRFLSCGSSAEMLSPEGIEDEIAEAILNWALEQAGERRKASAAALRKKLETLLWREWRELRIGPESVNTRSSDELAMIIRRQRKDFPYRESAFYCYRDSGIKVVDTSSPVDNSFLNKMKSFGVEVVARYYGYTKSAPPPDGRTIGDWQTKKVISSVEVEKLLAKNMASIAVFQYLGGVERTFANWRVRAPSDADRALQLAEELGQPKGTLIYFAVDGNFVRNEQVPCKRVNGRAGDCSEEVYSYFGVVSEKLKNANYRVGVYGSGETCKQLKKRNLVDACWMNFSPSHEGRTWGLQAGNVSLRQISDVRRDDDPGDIRRCSRELDFNEIRAPEFGQFIYKPSI